MIITIVFTNCRLLNRTTIITGPKPDKQPGIHPPAVGSGPDDLEEQSTLYSARNVQTPTNPTDSTALRKPIAIVGAMPRRVVCGFACTGLLPTRSPPAVGDPRV